MAVSITGVVINFVMVIIIFILVILGFVYVGYLDTCETKQSPFCKVVNCPCDEASGGGPIVPCSGYAKQIAGPNKFYCSQGPTTPVDSNGNPI